MDNFKKLIGNRIRERRLEMGIKTQAGLAELCDVDTSRVNRWEVGDNYPDDAFRARLKRVLKVQDSFFDIGPELLAVDASPDAQSLILGFVRAPQDKRARILGYVDSLVGPDEPKTGLKPQSS